NNLASSSDPLNEELQCSVCLDVFTNPVTTPCGHNFCKSCLNQCWDKSEDCSSPFCKETFSRRPDLKINTALRQVVQHFKEKSGVTKSEVLCDICDDRKQKALKSCLMCQSSYCETHLEPHHRVPRLKKHKLINAVENLEDYICEQHERPLEGETLSWSSSQTLKITSNSYLCLSPMSLYSLEMLKITGQLCS
uniref:RING-type domain-containing protein n=1 Tax=Cyprinus carpio TaxID=7962 RepID=A0A8C2C4B4_CYPCA